MGRDGRHLENPACSVGVCVGGQLPALRGRLLEQAAPADYFGPILLRRPVVVNSASNLPQVEVARFRAGRRGSISPGVSCGFPRPHCNQGRTRMHLRYLSAAALAAALMLGVPALGGAAGGSFTTVVS